MGSSINFDVSLSFDENLDPMPAEDQSLKISDNEVNNPQGFPLRWSAGEIERNPHHHRISDIARSKNETFSGVSLESGLATMDLTDGNRVSKQSGSVSPNLSVGSHHSAGEGAGGVHGGGHHGPNGGHGGPNGGHQRVPAHPVPLPHHQAQDIRGDRVQVR